MSNTIKLAYLDKFSSLDSKNCVEGELIYVEETQSIYICHQGRFIRYSSTIFNEEEKAKNKNKNKNIKKKKF